MTARDPGDTAGGSAERLHGDVQRQHVRLVTPETPPPQHVSWYRIDPGEMCTFHVHTGKTETWLLIDGSGEARVGDRRMAVKAGDMIVTEPGTPHGLANTGTSPLRFVNIVSTRHAEPVSTREVEGP